MRVSHLFAEGGGTHVVGGRYHFDGMEGWRLDGGLLSGLDGSDLSGPCSTPEIEARQLLPHQLIRLTSVLLILF